MNIKSGYRTTEFWITLATQVIGIFTIAGVIGQDQSTQLAKAISDIIIILAPAVIYIYNRTWLKSKTVNN
ncbi:MAG TPA: hypothetical protein VE090_02130 [Methylomirabilota bacterium]|nr:hypothetical protein [Methylomirabilota bacterium]